MIGFIFVAASVVLGIPESDRPALDAMVAACPVVTPASRNLLLCLSEIGELGTAAEPAGPKIVGHLKSTDSKDRALAAVVLGMIGYRAAVPELVATLDGDDWRLALVSVRSLGWLRAVEARDAVQRVARTHSLAVVRRTADDALAAIDGRRDSAPIYGTDHFGHPDSPFRAVFTPFGDASNRCEDGPWRWGGQTIARDEAAEAAAGGPFARLRGVPADAPDVVAELAVDGGRLAGTNQGEWGGMLYYETTGGNAREIYEENIVDIMDGPDGTVAIAGVSHMSLNQDVVIAVVRTTGGYAAREKLPLPSRPVRTVRIDATALLISTDSGNVVLRPNWRLEDADCAGGASKPLASD